MSANKGHFSRRGLLRTALGSTLLLPLLRLRRSAAQDEAVKRLILVYTPNGFPESFWPTSSAADPGFSLSSSMQAFAGLEERLLFVRPLYHTSSFDDHHAAGMAQLFTGAAVQTASPFHALGPSLDHVLTRYVGDTAHSSIHLGVGQAPDTPAISYRGRRLPIENEQSPLRALKALFGVEPDLSEAELGLRRQVREQMLDVSLDQLDLLRGYLGSSEVQKVEQHMAALRDLSRVVTAPTTPGCAPPELAAAEPDPEAAFMAENSATTQSIRAHTKVLRAALQCDLTRIATLQLFGPGAALPPLTAELAEQYNVADWHEAALGGAATAPLYEQFHQYFAQAVAELALSLATSVDVYGNALLDNTLIIWSTESGTGHAHGPSDIPYLLIGGNELGIQTGQFLQNDESMPVQSLFVAVCQAFGHDVQGFGELPDAGALPGILVP